MRKPARVPLAAAVSAHAAGGPEIRLERPAGDILIAERPKSSS